MKNILFILFLSIWSVTATHAQAPSIQWQKCLGGSMFDWASSIQPTTDGGYIVVGQSESNDGDVTGYHGHNNEYEAGDIWVVKLNSAGNLQWQKCLGGSKEEEGFNIYQTTDGGYMVFGETNSNNGDVNGYHGGTDEDTDGDIWVVKLNSSGNIQWQKCLGGSNEDEIRDIHEVVGGGYIVLGTTWSNDGDVTGFHGGEDLWVVKLNSTGNIQWQKCLGGSMEENPTSIKPTTDGGYIVLGTTWSNDGDVTGYHENIEEPNPFDIWIVKLNSTGNIQWQKCLGGSMEEDAGSVYQTTDGGFIVTGETSSNDGDVSGNHYEELYDMWVVKLNSSGNIQWQKCFGGTMNEHGGYIYQTTDGGYMVFGGTNSNNGNVTDNHGKWDIWIVKLNSTGNIQWQKCLGGSYTERGRSAFQTADGGVMVTGITSSNDGDVSGNHGVYNGDDPDGGPYDIWLVKLNSSGNIQWQKCLGGNKDDDIYNILQITGGGYIVLGHTESNNGDVSGYHGRGDFWVVKLSGIPTGIRESSTNIPFSVYPNPSNGTITIEVEKSSSLFGNQLKIFNVFGLEVFHSTINHTSLSIDMKHHGGSGMYLINILNSVGEVLGVQKIILQ